MPRDIEEPNTDTVHGDEQHPAWGMIGASRVSHSPPGAVLFDSDIRHQHSVVIRIGKATRRRDLHRDWLYRKREFIEVEMSEAQWASFVSSMNSGDGVACTLRYRDGERIPGMPYAPRLQESMGEVRDAAEKTIADVAKAFAAYKAHKTVGNLRFLEATISNLPANVRSEEHTSELQSH